MAIDGVNLSALKIKDENNSLRHSIQSETDAGMKKEDITVGIDQQLKSQQIAGKEDNYGEDVENTSYGGGSSDKNLTAEEENNNELIEEYEKRYELKFSEDKSIAKIYDNESEEYVESIETKKFIEIASKLTNAPGLIYNEKV